MFVSRSPTESLAGQVLIIDDDELIAVTLYEYLVEQGLRVDRAADSEQAHLALRNRKYEVVIVDGYLTGQLKDRAEDLLNDVAEFQPDARTVVLTAYSTDGLVHRSLRSDAMTILEKPKPVPYIAGIISALLAEATELSE